MFMLAALWELAEEDQARLRTRALADWALSAGAADHPTGNVACDLYEHAGRAYAVVATFDYQVLAWYRVSHRSGRLYLHRGAADASPVRVLAADPLAVHSRSANLRARSQILAGVSAHLRARSESACSRAAQSQVHTAGVHVGISRLPGGPGGDPATIPG